jgi:hypothetical protein
VTYTGRGVLECRALAPGSPLIQPQRSKVGQSGPNQAPTIDGPAMTDKSPRQTMTKKSGKSLKEKRAAKHAKTAAKTSSTEALLHDKKR